MDTPITKENINNILRFLPMFEGPTAQLYQVETERPTLYPYNYSAELHEFIAALYRENLIYSFDWPSWQAKAALYTNDPGLVAQADLLVLRKLFTTHVRADRFVDGHIAAMIDSGHILAILKRLQVLRNTLDSRQSDSQPP